MTNNLRFVVLFHGIAASLNLVRVYLNEPGWFANVRSFDTDETQITTQFKQFTGGIIKQLEPLLSEFSKKLKKGQSGQQSLNVQAAFEGKDKRKILLIVFDAFELIEQQIKFMRRIDFEERDHALILFHRAELQTGKLANLAELGNDQFQQFIIGGHRCAMHLSDDPSARNVVVYRSMKLVLAVSYELLFGQPILNEPFHHRNRLRQDIHKDAISNLTQAIAHLLLFVDPLRRNFAHNSAVKTHDAIVYMLEDIASNTYDKSARDAFEMQRFTLMNHISTDLNVEIIDMLLGFILAAHNSSSMTTLVGNADAYDYLRNQCRADILSLLYLAITGRLLLKVNFVKEEDTLDNINSAWDTVCQLNNASDLIGPMFPDINAVVDEKLRKNVLLKWNTACKLSNAYYLLQKPVSENSASYQPFTVVDATLDTHTRLVLKHVYKSLVHLSLTFRRPNESIDGWPTVDTFLKQYVLFENGDLVNVDELSTYNELHSNLMAAYCLSRAHGPYNLKYSIRLNGAAFIIERLLQITLSQHIDNAEHYLSEDVSLGGFVSHVHKAINAVMYFVQSNVSTG